MSSYKDLENFLLEDNTLIHDLSPLEHNYKPYPEEILFLENSLKKVIHLLKFILKGNKAKHIMIYGVPGVGKTTILDLIKETLLRFSQNNPTYSSKPLKIISNLTPHNQRDKKLSKVSFSLNHFINQLCTYNGLEVPDLGSSAEIKLNNLLKLYNNYIKIFILDEIGNVKDIEKVLYILSKTEDLVIIGSSSNLALKEKLEEDLNLSSNFVGNSTEVKITSYNQLQMLQILEKRIEKALVPNSVSEGVLPKLIATVLREYGSNMRVLISIFRDACLIANMNKKSNVDLESLTAGIEEYKKQTLKEDIVSFSIQSKITLFTICQLIREKREVTSGKIYELYTHYCELLNVEPVSTRRVSDYVNELDFLGMIEANVVYKGRYGRTKAVKTARYLPVDYLRYLLKDDSFRGHYYENEFFMQLYYELFPEERLIS